MQTRRSLLHPSAGLFLAVLLFCAWPLLQVQKQLEEYRARVTAAESLQYLPSGKFLSTVVLGFDNLAADLLWVRGISLFGERYRQSQDSTWFTWLFQLIDLASDLDPLDARIYKYGGLMLRLDPNGIDQSTYIFQKGMKFVPDEFFLPFGVAMNYFEHKQNTPRAAEFMKIASTKKNAPFYLRNLAATMLDQSREQETALKFLEEQLQAIPEGSLQRRAVEVKILEVRHDMAARDLKRGLREYLSRYHRIPESLEALRETTWKGAWPVDPYGGRFVLDRDGQIRSERYWQARARIKREVGLGVNPEELKEDGPGPRPQ